MANAFSRFRRLELVVPGKVRHQSAGPYTEQIRPIVQEIAELLEANAALEEIQGGAEYLVDVIRLFRTATSSQM